MNTLAKYHVCNHCVIGEKTFKNILIGFGKLPGLSRNGPQTFIDNVPVNDFLERVEGRTKVESRNVTHSRNTDENTENLNK